MLVLKKIQQLEVYGNSRQSEKHTTRNIKNRPKTLKKNNLVRRIAAGALAISVLAGAYMVHRHNVEIEDERNRIEYVDNIIDRDSTVQDYKTYCGIDFTDDELARFLEVEGKIDSFEGKESRELDSVDIIMTARQFKEIYMDIVKERLEEVFGYSIENSEIQVVRERDDLDGKPGDYNEKGHISQIGYMEHINNKNIPKDLRNSVIAAFGGEGIEKPAMTVDELISKLDNQEIDKAEASKYLISMFDDVKELMTRQYEEKEYGKLQEKESTTYNVIKEREKQTELAENNKNNAAITSKDDEIEL